MPYLTPIKTKNFIKFLDYVGCRLKRTKGDHLIFDRIGLQRPIVVPNDREVPVFIIRNNLRTLGIEPEEFLEILKKI